MDWAASPFLTLYIVLAVTVFSLGFWFRARIGPAEQTPPLQLNALELAYLAGGASRLGDASLFSLLQANAAIIAPRVHTITVTDQAALDGLVGKSTHLRVQPNMTRAQFQTAVEPLTERVRRRLQNIGYCPDRQSDRIVPHDRPVVRRAPPGVREHEGLGGP
jgi:uncharacterized protein (TIGR04222 family)